ncbi:16S rRNA (guanine(966)-N(2))-methyltransferase RsmD [Peptoniphilus porci]|uniref:16S rRNA (Guanine(966)-N(2))-methyltransferase RsmD n=1 Tax=Peptoniphilus porci TaxID=2652280 RepID=A0A1U7LY53_9FIRM|nr:16S rRNA (guanine(966)-N(2))-methyltransferase RsmD [Peptoniphilus porci]OLR64323.1 16S rRNA (guanine(966)-N(2))-methyltransferase RsmD [Peptoniphilus porci]
MRIISGNRRGLKLKAPEGFDTRPTEDRVKESVFNILGQNFFDDIILDLFCGSGANGIEFISRGAKKAYFVDKSKEAIDCVKYNLDKAKFLDYAVIIEDHLNKALRSLDIRFDYIYMDPPFDRRDLYKKAFKLIREKRLLKPEGQLIVEYNSDIPLLIGEGFVEMKNKEYGNTSISICGWDIDEGNICG